VMDVRPAGGITGRHPGHGEVIGRDNATPQIAVPEDRGRRGR
jgi:hypothetical protein